MIKKVLLTAMSMLLLTSTMALASTATYTPATTYTNNTAKDADDTFTTRVYEGSSLKCSSTSSSCSFTEPACGTGVHTYAARTHSSKYALESANSNSVTWTAPICPKTPKPPTILTIGTN